MLLLLNGTVIDDHNDDNLLITTMTMTMMTMMTFMQIIRWQLLYHQLLVQSL